MFNPQLNTDILLIVWNYDIPPKTLKLVAQSFWEEINPRILPFLEKQNRCFVIIWANVDKKPLNGNGFTALQTPDKFDLNELLPWFHNQLRIKGVGEDGIENYRNMLKDQCGNLLGTYQEINKIIHQINRGSRFYE